MFFFSTIVQLYKKGTSPKDIVFYFNNQYVTEKYVQIAINKYKLANRRYTSKHQKWQVNPPKPNTISRTIYDKIHQTMTMEEFIKSYKINVAQLAKKLEVPYMNLRRFYQGFVTGRINHAPNCFENTPKKITTYVHYRKYKSIEKSEAPTTEELTKMKELF